VGGVSNTRWALREVESYWTAQVHRDAWCPAPSPPARATSTPPAPHTWKERDTMTGALLLVCISSLICALTSASPYTCGGGAR
jgi:hypothetical protein